MEVMSLMGGDFGKVQNFKKRSVDFIKSLIGDHNPTIWAKRSATKISECMLVPDSLIE